MRPDLVLLYDSLPDIASWALCRQIKNDPLHQLAPVVLVKPSPDPWDIYRGRAAGALDIWAAPRTLSDALGRIQTLAPQRVPGRASKVPGVRLGTER